MRFLSSLDYVDLDSALWKSVQGFDVDGQLLVDIGKQAWEWFARNGGRETLPRFWDDAYFGASRRLFPVVGVSWYEAAAYCVWLTRHYKEFNLPVSGEVVFRLPKEQEWMCAFSGKAGGPSLKQSSHPKMTAPTRTVTVLRDDAVSPLFQAAAEAAEEAILDSLFKAVRTEGRDGHVAEALPLERVRDLLK